MKKKVTLALIVLLMIVSLTSCMSLLALWPDVQPPVDQSASMLIVEVGDGIRGDSEALFNSNATGWAPWVVDEQGNLIAFKPFDAESRLDSFFYAENLKPGKYTLKGFMHVYVDYEKIPDEEVIYYGPFEDYSYHVKQFFPIDKGVSINLESGNINTFGRYYITYNWKEGAAGTTDDRWKVSENSVKIVYDANDKKALRVAKNWATPNWTLWNERNSEEAADN
ncbi:MAG: hypothetical protein WC162_11370 [Sphaerochaetaceae bacterium]